MSKKIVTHNAKFHTDDVFAVATLFLFLGKDNCEVIRTRDRETIDSADYVVDVGEVNDASIRRFDHHQSGGAGERANGVPYASFGLVWNEYGEKISGSSEVKMAIDGSLVQAIDAVDNGVNISTPIIEGVYNLEINGIINTYRSTWKEKSNWDSNFIKAVDWAVEILKRLIKIHQDVLDGKKIVEEIYKSTENKQLIVIEEKYSFGRELVMDVLVNYPEPLYAVLYRDDVGGWQVVAIRRENGTFDLRKPLPNEWGAKRDEDLAQITGVADAEFCHRRLFMCTAWSREGALELAKIALNS
jgi:uncharacterized UPF0160 family protein